MPNLHRGEVEACLDGRMHTLCLTLGALAELEAAFGDEDMLALANRFATGRLSARDAIRILGAGLRGAGNNIADEVVARMQADGGAGGFVDLVARLLTATFGSATRMPATADAAIGATDTMPASMAATGAMSHPPMPGVMPGPFPGPR